MKKIIALITVLVSMALLVGCQSSADEKKVGIIMPIEHNALNEIVKGFTENLKSESKTPIRFKIANAEGDLNMERAIIQQMRDENYDLIVPIGTDATQMTKAMVQEQPILSLAATFTQQDRDKAKPCNIAVVQDEIPVEKSLEFIHIAYPKLSKLVLVHSTSEKIYPEVAKAIAAGKKIGIDVKPMMVSTLNDLYSTANAIPAGTQGIFILKDNLIASGISTLALTAEKNHIPLITSDQGTVQGGAAFAIGVHEAEIGAAGAKLGAAILAGQSACSLPIVTMTKLTLFINKNSLGKEGQNLAQIEKAANAQHYKVEYVSDTDA